jgi:hypothetical protein
VRYVQVARQGASQSDGIAVLDDSRAPTELHIAGAYRLSEELAAAGTVPQCGGARRCSAKSKGWPIDTFLERAAREPFRQAVGFNAGEQGRARRDAGYNDARRTGIYPLIESEFDRDACRRYIEEVTGIADWPKSACEYCPFALTNRAGRARVLQLFDRNPDAALRTLLLEHRSVCLNPAQGLIAGGRLADLLARSGRHGLLGLLHAELERAPHALYAVRRIRRPRADDPTRQANASRHLEILAEGARAQMVAALATHGRIEERAGASRVWLIRGGERLPSRQHYLVVAPAGAEAKGDPRFEQWWSALDAGPTSHGLQLAA